MAARRIIYIALLIGAAVLHFAYGQYATHYVLLFLLCLPLVSLALAIPAALLSRARLEGGGSVYRGSKSSVKLEVSCRFILPPEGWNIRIETENLFTCEDVPPVKVHGDSVNALDMSFDISTAHIGTLRLNIKKARVYDYLGLFPIPVKKDPPVYLTVLPVSLAPVPEPELVDLSFVVFKPKPQGFSEEHELRPYREGDPLNLIHWKLSEKFDKTIIREPQEVLMKRIVLSCSLTRSYDEQQSVIEQLCWLNETLEKEGRSYTVQFGGRSERITCGDDFDAFIKDTLVKPMRVEDAPPMKSGDDIVVYAVQPQKEVRDEA